MFPHFLISSIIDGHSAKLVVEEARAFADPLTSGVVSYAPLAGITVSEAIALAHAPKCLAVLLLFCLPYAAADSYASEAISSSGIFNFIPVPIPEEMQANPADVEDARFAILQIDDQRYGSGRVIVAIDPHTEAYLIFGAEQTLISKDVLMNKIRTFPVPDFREVHKTVDTIQSEVRYPLSLFAILRL